MRFRWPWQKKSELRAISWPFDVGPPSSIGGRQTADSALTLSAVYACVRLLSESVASLPLRHYRRTGDRPVEVGSSWLQQPTVYGTDFDWKYQCMTSLLLHGNSYGMITNRDGFQYPTSVEWLRTEDMYVQEHQTHNPLFAKFHYQGVEIPRQDLVHIRAFTVPGRIEGISPIRSFASTIGSGLAAMQYGNEWFAKGGIPSGTFKNTQQIVDRKAADEMKARLNQVVRDHGVLVYGMDWDYNPLAVPPEEAQFLESMRLTATQIAAIYDIPPERAGGVPGGSLTYATEEQDQLRLAATIGKWCIRLERAFNMLLPERQYTKFNVDAMIRTDTLTRHQIYKIDREIGMRNIDELRQLDELEPLPNGEGKDYAPLAVTVAEASAASKPPATPEDLPVKLPRPRVVGS